MSPHGLGLSDAESWAITPREYLALVEVRKASKFIEAYHASMYANVHRAKDQAPLEWEHFLGKPLDKKPMRTTAEIRRDLWPDHPQVKNELPDWAIGNLERQQREQNGHG